MSDYTTGDDFYADEDARDGKLKTYGISVRDHGNKIEVYGDRDLRDRILAFLNEKTARCPGCGHYLHREDSVGPLRCLDCKYIAI